VPGGGKKGSFIFVLSIYVRFCPVLFDFVRFLACIESGGGGKFVIAHWPVARGLPKTLKRVGTKY